MPNGAASATDTKNAQDHGGRDSRARRLARLDRMAHALDSRFRIPGTSIRFGWDSILGLVPGLGGLVTLGPAALQIIEAVRMKVRRRILLRMCANAGIDFVVGGIPVIGDLFDVFFKSNRRNLALLKSELGSEANSRTGF